MYHFLPWCCYRDLFVASFIVGAVGLATTICAAVLTAACRNIVHGIALYRIRFILVFVVVAEFGVFVALTVVVHL